MSLPTVLSLWVIEAAEFGIFFYPEATINNRNFYGLFNAPEVFEMICHSLLSQPKQCYSFSRSKQTGEITL